MHVQTTTWCAPVLNLPQAPALHCTAHPQPTREDNEEGEEEPGDGKDPELADALAGRRAVDLTRLRLQNTGSRSGQPVGPTARR